MVWYNLVVFNVLLNTNQPNPIPSVSFSVRFNSHFPGGPGLTGTGMYPSGFN